MLKKSLLILCTVLSFVFMVSCGENSTRIIKDDTTDASSDDSVSENPDNEGTTDSSEENPDGNDNPEDPNIDPDENSEDPLDETATVAEPSHDFEAKTEALIVTTEKFAEVFAKFAAFHTVTGINTKVVTVENICSNAVCDDNDPMNDTQKAIKDYVMSVNGLRYLVLGGDIEEIPSREVNDHFEIPLVADYTDDFYSDLYYADFSNWDLNGNGTYAEDEDAPVLIANVAVGRISVSTVEEAELYFSKLVKHHTAFNTAHTTKSLLLANIATELSGIKVNSGYYFETEGKTISQIPMNYSIKKLYTKSTPFPGGNTAEYLDNNSEKAAIEEGMNLIVHSGHGAPSLLTCEQGTDPDRDFSGTMAYNLENETLPFFLSCACEAGQFVKKDSAGEKLMNAPKGGAIVYLGNTTTGLGIAGGSQFIDEMLKNMFASSSSIIGDSYLYAHLNMPQSDTFNPPIQMVNINVPVVNKDSWTWTKKSIVMLGDPMTVFWRDPVEPLTTEITVKAQETDEGKTVLLQFPKELEGAALRIFADGNLYDIPYLMNETVKIELDSSAETIAVGLKAENSQYFFKEFDI